MKKTFTIDDQNNFADLSGDYNPVHIDPVAARRMIFGGQVVHGINQVMWSLDNWLNNSKERISLESLSVSFKKPLMVGDTAEIEFKEDKNKVTSKISCSKSLVTEISFCWKVYTSENSTDLAGSVNISKKSINNSVDDIENCSGSLELFFNHNISSLLFQNIPVKLSTIQAAQLLSTTRLVGMVCPGLNSIFSTLNLVFENNSYTENSLKYFTAKVNKRFRQAEISIESINMKGDIKAFIRPSPQLQVSSSDLKSIVGHNDYSDQKALIIGGSRGLGEVCAKILAAGGADVVITYYKGGSDAEEVINDINSSRGKAKCLQFDILEKDLSCHIDFFENWQPTHIYYLASPFIGIGNKGRFSDEIFNHFCNYYVSGFNRLIEFLSNASLKAVYYPSTVFIEKPPANMGEYTAAKQAGESLCSYLAKIHPSTSFYTPRLPKMSTDQTLSILPVKNDAPQEVMLESIRKFSLRKVL
jgi:hypothetical protein